MKLFSKADRELLVVLTTVFTTVLVCIILWFFQSYQIDLMKKGYIDGIANSNEYIVKQISSKISAEASDGDEAIEIIMSAPSSGTRYWLLFSPDGMLYERDAATTSRVGGMNYTELESYYLRNGGESAGPFLELIQSGEFFSAVTTKDVNIGNEIISADFVDVGGEQYCVASSILQSYMFSVAKIGERIMLLRILMLVTSAMMISLSAVLSTSNRKKVLIIQKIRKELMEKNLLVQEQGERNGESPGERPADSTDPLTGFYSQSFFDTILTKLTDREARNIGIIVVRLRNMISLRVEKGSEYSDRALLDTAVVILSHTEPKDMCIRICTNEFAVLKLGTTDKLTLQTAKLIFHDLKAMDSGALFTAGFSFLGDRLAADTFLESAWSSAKKL
jgi:GGDEF domain-containing protein